MSSYQNVIGGKLKLKGKALDVKSSGLKKKKKKQRHHYDDEQIKKTDIPEGGSSGLGTDNYSTEELPELPESEKQEGLTSLTDLPGLTPAEKRYIEQKERIDRQKLAKTADKSHRDRISDFNQYLANLSEHYDIPKVGPG